MWTNISLWNVIHPGFNRDPPKQIWKTNAIKIVTANGRNKSFPLKVMYTNIAIQNLDKGLERRYVKDLYQIHEQQDPNLL